VIRKLVALGFVATAAMVAIPAPAYAAASLDVTAASTPSGSTGVVQGTVQWNGGTQPTVDGITIKVTRNGQDIASVVWCSGTTNGCGSASASFSWSTPSLAYNGPYQVTVLATGSQHATLLNPCDGSCDGSGGASQSFALAVPPLSPKALATTVDTATHAVTITWTRNSEPDMVGYAVQRTGANTSTYQSLAEVGQPPPNQKVSYTDSTASQAGGTYTYQVVAVRNGANASSYTVSDPSTRSVFVDGPTATTAAGGGAPGSAGGDSGQVAAPGRPPILTQGGSVDASKFSILQSQTKIPANQQASTATTIEPDTGFNENLPFRKATTATTKADPDGSAFPAIVHASSTDNRKALLVSLAFAAIIFTLAFHIRYLMRRIDQVA
jgi:hypothetical protein